MKNLFLTLFFSFLTISAFSVTVEWTGNTGNWNVGSNWSTGSIPTVNDNVIIPSGAHVFVPSGYNARTKAVYVEANGTITINQNGKLRSIGANNSSGIVNDGTIYNSGIINVRDLTSNSGVDIYSGLENNGLVISNSHGIIRIKRIEGTGIFNYANRTFSNFGRIEIIEGVEGEGIATHGTFNNYDEINLGSTGQTALINTGSFFNDGGKIQITDSALGDFGFSGFHNQGHFQNEYKSLLDIRLNQEKGYFGGFGSSIYNNGNIYIENIWGPNAVAFLSGGAFENDTAGIIETQQTPIGMQFSQDSQNAGELNVNNFITDTGLLILSTFTNLSTGAIVSLDYDFRGIYCASTGEIENFGYLKIGQGRGAIASGITIHGIFENQSSGLIEIAESVFGILNFNIFDNYGTIHAGSDISSTVIADASNFTNHNGGSILLEEFLSTAFRVEDTGNTLNNGLIEVESSLTFPTGIYLIGSFANSSTGQIHISDIDDSSIFLQSTGTLTNQGDLHISPRNAGSGININGQVINEGTGHIDIYGHTGTGHSILVQSSGSVINKDDAFIELTSTNDIFTNGIANYGQFENTDCAKVWYAQRINNQGTFSNNAWMEDHYISTHTNAGDFQNTGIIQDHEPSFQNINIDNEGAIIESIQGPIQAGSAIQNALNVSSNTPNNIKIKALYIDSNGNDFAGYYDIFNNVLYLENNTQGLSTLYIRIDNTPGTCQGFIPIPITGGIHLVGASDSNIAEDRDFEQRQTPTISTSIYPNPSTGNFHLNGDFPAGEYQVAIFNQLGKKIWEQQLNLSANPTKIQLENNFPTGMYFLQVRQEKTVISNQKIQLQNIR